MAGRLEGVIWDLDGTVADTLPLCIAAFQHAFQMHLGRLFSPAEIAALFGVTEEGMIRRVIPDRWKEVEQTFLTAYEQLHVDYTQPFAGIVNILELISARGIRLAMVTGKGRASTEISLKQLGLVPYFALVEVGSPDAPIKPQGMRAVLDHWQVAPEQCAYVGDTAYDMAAAAEVGVIGLGAGWAATATVGAAARSTAASIFTQVDEMAAWLDETP